MHDLGFKQKGGRGRWDDLSYIGQILEYLRNAFLWRRTVTSWWCCEPLQHSTVLIAYLNTMDLIHSVTKCLSEVQGYMTWKTSDYWGAGMHLWSRSGIPVFNFRNNWTKAWKLLGLFSAQCEASLNYSRNKGKNSEFYRFSELHYKLPGRRGRNSGCTLQLRNWSSRSVICRDSGVTHQVFSGLPSDNHCSSIQLLYKLLGHRWKRFWKGPLCH